MSLYTFPFKMPNSNINLYEYAQREEKNQNTTFQFMKNLTMNKGTLS